MANPCEQAMSQVVGTGNSSTSTHIGLSSAFKRLREEHAGVFALAKRLGMRSDPQVPELETTALDRSSQQLREMTELYRALREVLQTQVRASNDEGAAGDLADAMAALDAINPGSPEWGPGFLQVSELVEAELGIYHPPPKLP